MELKNSKIYIFKHKKCNQIFTTHPWTFKNSAKGQPLLMNVQNTAQIYFKREIALINYQQTKAYLWNVSVGVISLHLPTTCQNAQLFQFKLQEEDIKVSQWQKASDLLKKEIQKHCGADIVTKQNTQKGKLQKIGNKIGSLFGSLSRKVQGTPITDIVSNSQIVQKIKEKASDQLDKNPEQQKAKWSKMKEQVKSVNSIINSSLQPAREVVAKTASKWGQKFTNSDNKIIKSLREFGIQMKRSLNEGYFASQTKQTSLKENVQKPIQSERGLNNQKP